MLDTITIAVIDPQQDKILLLQRNPDAYPGYVDRFGGCWELVGGNIEQDEKPRAAAIRELMEETQLVIQPAQLQLIMVPIRFNSKDIICGNWVYVVFIEECETTISNEHTAYKWIPIHDAIQEKLAYKHNKLLDMIVREVQVSYANNTRI